MPAWTQFRMDASRHVSRRAGQTAVAAAAYRAGARLWDERAQEAHDYSRRYGVVANGFVTPEAGAPDWSREQLWNAAEAAEARKDARTARKLELALPEAMTTEQREALVRAWAADIADRYKVVVDWAIHLPDREGDQRNHHAHLMLTTREIGPDGFGGKAALELSNTDQKKRGLPVGDDAIYALRETLAERLNTEAARHDLDLHADPRSYADRGIDLVPTKHVGVHAVAMDRRGKESDRAEIHAAVRGENAARIMARPETVLDTLTQREAVFTRTDIARELHRHLDDPEQFRNALARLDASPELVRLSEGCEGQPARFSTQEMVAVEARMMATAEALSRPSWDRAVDAEMVLARPQHGRLSAEQREAVEHVTGPKRIGAISGTAGAGKSASLAAAREAWEEAGLRVRGGALAGKAAEELQRSAGIESRTLHALEYGWRQGRDPLGARDVLVIDEAGMVGSRQLGRVLEAAEQAGAKVVLVGDARQLQPIEAGAAFRAVAEQIGVAEIDTVRRQREGWQREASQAFARGDTEAGLMAYAERGQVCWAEDREAAMAAMVRDAVAAEREGGSSLLLAHTNADVAALNTRMRAERQAAGLLGAGDQEAPFQAERGERRFAAGDRIVFLRNDRDLGVKNGTLGTVQQAGPDRLTVRLDGDEPSRRPVQVERARYDQVDHGYAVTLHKAQGATVDRAALLASGGMDRHLAYVGMTRHREQATLYAGRDDFRDERDLAARLGRERAKNSTLDFAERRGFETERPWAENARAWVERGRERLRELGERIEQAATAVRDRFSGPDRTEKAARTEPVADRWSRLRAMFGREREAGSQPSQTARSGQAEAERKERLRAEFERTLERSAAERHDAVSKAYWERLTTPDTTARQAEQERGERLRGMFGADQGADDRSKGNEPAANPTAAERGKDADTAVEDYWKRLATPDPASLRTEQERKAQLQQAMQEPDKPAPTQGQGSSRGKGRSR